MLFAINGNSLKRLPLRCVSFDPSAATEKVLLKECIKSLQINDKEITEQEIMGKIGRAKDNMQSADSYYRQHESNYREKKIAEVYKMYQKRLKECVRQIFNNLPSYNHPHYRWNKCSRARDVAALCTFMFCVRWADAVGFTADRHIVHGADWFFFGIYYFKVFNISFFQFSAHYFCQRAD